MWSLVLLGLVAAVHVLMIARVILVPVVIAVLLAFLFRPPIRGLRRAGVPAPLAALLVLATLLALLGGGVYRLAGPAGSWLTAAPTTLRQVEQRVRTLREPVEDIRAAAGKLESLAAGPGPHPEPVVVSDGSLADAVFSQTGTLLAGTAITFALLFFLLAAGDRLTARIAALLPDGGDGAALVADIEHKLSGYLVAVALINAALGASVGLAAYLLGLPNPLLWAVLAALLNFIPYLGPMLGIGILAMVGLVTFAEPARALLPALAYFGLDVIEAYVVTPLVLGRRLALNPIAVLLGVIGWGWVWGVPGALLAVPLLVTLKIVCEEVATLRPIADLLAD